jgi:3-hydroxyisobutyrate dehydrogenase-like beta-hydroxyacid dehydrogenase
MAENIQKYLIKEDYPSIIVWNRTATRADSLKKLGATLADSVEDAVAKADIIFTSVPHSQVFSANN